MTNDDEKSDRPLNEKKKCNKHLDDAEYPISKDKSDHSLMTSP